jgi:serpin B
MAREATTSNRRPAAPSSREAVLHVADRVWVQAHWTYREDFLSILRDRYGAPPGELDFWREPEPARVEINAWVKKQTRGRIENLLPPRSVDRWTRLVLTNAVYFKACWALPFVARETREEDFATPKERVRTNMMRQVSQFGYGRLDGIAAVELRYFGSSMSMVVILPEDPEGLADVENRIGHDYDRWLAALASKRVDLWLPQWQETQDFVLDEILKGLGPRAFISRARRSPMVSSRPNPQVGAVVGVHLVGPERNDVDE